MVLGDIRTLFVELAGRSDLLDVDSVLDPDMFIREASKELDRRLFGAKGEGRYTVDVAAGQILVTIPQCRSIKEVWLYNSGDKTRLSKADSSNEIKEFYTETKTAITRSTPAVYYPINARSVPNLVDPTDFDQQQAFDDLLYSTPAAIIEEKNYVIMNDGGNILAEYSGKFILVNNSSPVILNAPAASEVGGIGTNYKIKKIGTGSLTIQFQGDDAINDSSVNGTIYCEETTRGDLSIVFVGGNTWVGSGSNIWITT